MSKLGQARAASNAHAPSKPSRFYCFRMVSHAQAPLFGVAFGNLCLIPPKDPDIYIDTDLPIYIALRKGAVAIQLVGAERRAAVLYMHVSK